MRHKALLVGLNHYADPANNLRGCVNDVLQMSRLLQERFAFDDADQIRLLTDERATTARIKDRLRWLLQDAAAGDVLVFHFSGHGAQVRDRDGDELEDGLDEIICPYDLDWDRPFTDDDLHACLGDLVPGVSLTVVLDCCHAGTGLRETVAGGGWPSRVRCLTPPPDIRHRSGPFIEDLGPGRRLTMTRPRVERRLRRFGARTAAQGAVLLAACRSDQTSADAWIDGDYHGAFTYALCAAAEGATGVVTYGELIKRTQHLLRNGRYEQIPQLEGPPDVRSRPALRPLPVAAPVS